ncbi:MAG: ABC transporter ATP-binding protein, partial [Thermoproteota archaeon]
ARGLINNPSIVLADEPTGNLDSVTSEKVIQLMKSMAKKLNQTFIVVTHDRQHFGDVDRVITIKDGKAFEGNLPSEMEALA